MFLHKVEFTRVSIVFLLSEPQSEWKTSCQITLRWGSDCTSISHMPTGQRSDCCDWILLFSKTENIFRKSNLLNKSFTPSHVRLKPWLKVHMEGDTIQSKDNKQKEQIVFLVHPACWSAPLDWHIACGAKRKPRHAYWATVFVRILCYAPFETKCSTHKCSNCHK